MKRESILSSVLAFLLCPGFPFPALSSSLSVASFYGCQNDLDSFISTLFAISSSGDGLCYVVNLSKLAQLQHLQSILYAPAPVRSSALPLHPPRSTPQKLVPRTAGRVGRPARVPRGPLAPAAASGTAPGSGAGRAEGAAPGLPKPSGASPAPGQAGRSADSGLPLSRKVNAHGAEVQWGAPPKKGFVLFGDSDEEDG